jgi:solute carrier family 8 (sodium/calcium exchanger)
MDLRSSILLNLTLLQVTDAGNASARMEAIGYVKSMDSSIESGLNIKLCATDRHVQIRKVHHEKYLPKNIVHEFDVYHLANSIRKRLVLLSKKKRFNELAPWIRSIVNHLWWCAASCNGNADNLVEKWLSICEHIINMHHFPKNKLYKACYHETITRYDVNKK